MDIKNVSEDFGVEINNFDCSQEIKFDEIESNTLSVLEKPTYLDLFKNAVLNSDGVVIASDQTDPSIVELANAQNKPVLKCGFKEGFKKEYLEFYSSKILS